MSDETTGGVPFQRQADAAWREFRGQLADHLATMDAQQHLVLNVDVGVDDEGLAGAAPYVQFLGSDDGARIRAEVVSDHYLDERWALGRSGAAGLRADGWQPPTFDSREEAEAGSANWFLDRDTGRVDELADLAVRTLRAVFGCAHPAFLWTEGDLAPTGSAAPRPAEAPAESADPDHTAAEDRVEHPGDHAELLALVRRTLQDMRGAAVEADRDGDFPLRVGQSVLYVRVWESEPAVELFAELVVDVEDRAAARREVNATNREAILGCCFVRGDVVRFRHVLCAWPFSTMQLRSVLGRIAADLDERAEEMAERVGGLRFLEHREGSEAEPDEHAHVEPSHRVPPTHPMLPVLRELLDIEEPSDRVVAGLFDGDVERIATTIAAVREDPPDDIDVADAIALLRLALGYAARKRADRAFGSRPQPPRRRGASQQSALISHREVDGAGLDLGIDG